MNNNNNYNIRHAHTFKLKMFVNSYEHTCNSILYIDHLKLTQQTKQQPFCLQIINLMNKHMTEQDRAGRARPKQDAKEQQIEHSYILLSTCARILRFQVSSFHLCANILMRAYFWGCVTVCIRVCVWVQAIKGWRGINYDARLQDIIYFTYLI